MANLGLTYDKNMRLTETRSDDEGVDNATAHGVWTATGSPCVSINCRDFERFLGLWR